MMLSERADVVYQRVKDFRQKSMFSIRKIIIEVIRSAQFAAVEECIKEIINTKTMKNDTLMKYRNRIIKSVNTVKAREV